MSQRRAGRFAAAMVIGLLVGCGGGGDAVEGPGADTGGDGTTTEAGVAGITVTPTSGLTTSEKGGTATFTVVLTAAPTADVTIGISSSNEKEGTVSPKSLVFSATNWNAPQTVTVTGVDDSDADGTQTYKIVTAPATSADPAYNGKDGDDVEVKNTDDESAGITVTPTSGLKTSEAKTTASFTIVLNRKPSADVEIPISTSNDKEGVPNVSVVKFTPLDWSSPHKVTVTGVDDTAKDGDQAYEIVTGAAKSDDASYSGLDADNVKLTNVDNESAGVTVLPVAGLKTTEAGGTATFAIVLNAKPTGDVTIPLSSSNAAEGTVSPKQVVFTSLNWDAPQIVTVTGVDDAVADGNQLYKIVTGAALSADTLYSGFDPDDVELTNVDNETAGITVKPIAGLSTTEAGGQATFTIVLNSAPSGDVTIPLSSSDTAEGTLAVASVTFTKDNWNAPKTITVTGVDDAVADGARTYKILTAAAKSADKSYEGIDADDVTLTNIDNDTPSISVRPNIGSITDERGLAAAEISIVLNSKPTANVTIPLSVSKPSEGKADVTSVTFTPLNWNAPQTVTVKGVNDDIADGNQMYWLETGAATSTDTRYAGLDADDASITNIDDDSAGIRVMGSTITTTEAGGTATFRVVLNSKPTANVTIPVRSSRTTEGTVAPASLVFTTDDWNAPQTITVTGKDDFIADGAQPYKIILDPATSTDTGYAGMDPTDVDAINTDNDSAGITVSKIDGDTTEVGGTAKFTIRLNSQPLNDVVIDLSSSRETEGTVPKSITITPLNWDTKHEVLVKGVDDEYADGRQPYSIITAAAKSADPTYNGMPVDDVDVFNTDDDSAGIRVTYVGKPTKDPLRIDESGTKATFTVRLESKPTKDVIVPIHSSDTTEGTLAIKSLTFTTDNWKAEQTVEITGFDDKVVDGNQTFSIVTDPATSADPGYAGRDAEDVPVINVDDDKAGITVTKISGPTAETGGFSTFTIKLNSEPTANVTVKLHSDDLTEGDVGTASVTFTPADYGEKEIKVSGKDDDIADGDRDYKIVTEAATSTDPNYNGLDADDVAVTNKDNDAIGFTISAVSPAGGSTTEAGGTVSFTVRLNSEPTAEVRIPVKSSNTAEGKVSTSELVFTTANWKFDQTVTVTGQDDFVEDGNPTYTIELGLATGGDYAGKDPADVTLVNIDDDKAGIVVSPTSGLTTTEAKATASFTITLNSKPTADVTIDLASSDTTEGTIVGTSVVFKPSDWTTSKSVSKTIVVTGVDDTDIDGDIKYKIVTGASVSTDSKYNGLAVDDVDVTNTDNDFSSKRVFVTAELYTGNLGGLAGADAKCQAAATGAGLSGTYKAWLSSTTESAGARLTHHTGAYVLTTGTVVANSWTDLTDNNLISGINRTQTGALSTATAGFMCGLRSVTWTGTYANGNAAGAQFLCSNWTTTTGDSGGGSWWGNADATSTNWSWACYYGGTSACAQQAALYCLEQ